MFLGHIVGFEGIKLDLKKKAAVVGDWAVLQHMSALRTFLGLTNYFLRFVQGYVNLVGSLLCCERMHPLCGLQIVTLPLMV